MKRTLVLIVLLSVFSLSASHSAPLPFTASLIETTICQHNKDNLTIEFKNNGLAYTSTNGILDLTVTFTNGANTVVLDTLYEMSSLAAGASVNIDFADVSLSLVGNYAVSLSYALSDDLLPTVNGSSSDAINCLESPTATFVKNVVQVNFQIPSHSLSIATTVSGGQAPYSYLWSRTTGSLLMSTNKDLNNEIGCGELTFEVTDDLGCKYQEVMGTNEYSVNTQVVNASCHYQTYDGQILTTMVGGVAPFKYIWSNGSTGANLYDAGEGTYTVYIADAMGCDLNTSSSISYNHELPTASIDYEPSIILNNSTTLTAVVNNPSDITSYEWMAYNEDFQISSVNRVNPTFSLTPNAAFYVKLKVFDVNGCSYETQYETVTPVLSTSTISRSSSSVINVFPNPSKGMISVEGLTSTSTMTITDMNGRAVYNSSIENGKNVDISSLEKGIYMLQFSNENLRDVRKLIVE